MKLVSICKAQVVSAKLDFTITTGFIKYDGVYQVQDLYEQVFYDRLNCTSPEKVATILESAVRQSRDNFTELRVFDFGAGNGMMAEELKNRVYHVW